MNIVLAVLAFILLLAGLIGSVLPIIPGPPLGYAGILVLQFSGYGNFSLPFLIILGVIIVVITVMDFILPAKMTKWFGGSRLAVIGSTLGLIVGMFFFPPIGLIAGPFLGALAGELINIQRVRAMKKITDGDSGEPEKGGNVKALVAALGAFLAFILGTGAKLISGAMMIYFAVKALV